FRPGTSQRPSGPEPLDREGWNALLGSASGWVGIVHLWSLDVEAWRDGDPERAPEVVYGSVLHLVQASLAKNDGHPPRLWLMTRGAHGPEGSAFSPDQSSLVGLARVIVSEHPELRCRHLDLDAGTDVDVLVRAMEVPERDAQIALRDGRAWVP